MTVFSLNIAHCSLLLFLSISYRLQQAFAPILEGYHHHKKVKLVPTPISIVVSRIGKSLGFYPPDDEEENLDKNSSSLVLSAVKSPWRNSRGSRPRSPSLPNGVHVETIHTEVTTTISTRSNNVGQLESGILDHERVGRRSRRSSEDLNGPWQSRGWREPSPMERLNDSSTSIKTTPSRSSVECR